jgi:hypothetical protein
MPLATVNLNHDIGADWQRVIRLRDPSTNQLVALSSAVMEIRNANFQLAMTLNNQNGRCVIASDGASVNLHITSADSLAAFEMGNFPGTYQAVGIWGIGRSYVYDLFVTYSGGVTDRILRGFFYADPNVTGATEIAS